MACIYDTKDKTDPLIYGPYRVHPSDYVFYSFYREYNISFHIRDISRNFSPLKVGLSDLANNGRAFSPGPLNCGVENSPVIYRIYFPQIHPQKVDHISKFFFLLLLTTSIRALISTHLQKKNLVKMYSQWSRGE